MKVKFTLLISCLLAGCLILFVPALAQDAAEGDCPDSLTDLSSDARTHYRNRNERIENLNEILHTASENLTSDFLYEVIYWAAMAEIADAQYDGVLPLCGDYKTLNDAYTGMINDAYAIASQLVLFARLEDDIQRQNVFDLYENRLALISARQLVWRLGYRVITS
jgi:hypothetical protein